MSVTVREKHGDYYIFVHQAGQTRSKKIPGGRKTAEAVADVLRQKLIVQEFGVGTGASAATGLPTFGEFAKHFLDTYAKPSLKYNTWRGYELTLTKHLLPLWRDRRLDEITRADVKRLILQKQKTLKPATVRNIVRLTSGVFTLAYEDEILDRNPALKLGRFIRKDDRREHVRPLTREQVNQFLAGVQQHRPQHHAIFLTAFRTGLRLGELLGLHWTDVDFAANQIHVRRSFSHSRMDSPKSKKSRSVDMSDQLKFTLLAHQRAMREKFGEKMPVCVFPAAEGGYMHSDNFRNRIFYPLIEKLNFSFRIHDMRHTFASLLLEQRSPIHYVKDQLGHASIQTTVDCYGHLHAGANRSEVCKLDDENGPLRIVQPATA